MDAADVVSIGIAAVAAVTGIAALVVAVLSYNRSKDSIREAKRSADQAERSADHAGEAVVEARRSADEAKRMREVDEDRRRQEREQRHEQLAPGLPVEINAEFRENERLGGGQGSLFGAVTVPRGYRVKAEAVMGRSRTELGLSMVAAPGREIEFQIEPWHPDQEAARTGEVLFRFWPPLEGDDVSTWGCGCGRPTGETLDGPGHWEQRVKVNYYRIQDSVH